MKAVFAAPLAIAGIVTMVALAGLPGEHAPAAPVLSKAVWSEVKWPFPMDQWGTGKAFTCSASDCGTLVSVYVRPKIGFCNCATGVADDAELDRVGDNELVGSAVRARGRGRPIKIGWMNGLSRAYTAAELGVLSVAYNDDCDVVVALATFKGDAAAIEPAVIDFLGSRPMVLWAKKELGLEFARRDW